MQLVALEGDRKTTLKNIVRDDKIISKDEILSAPIVFFKLTQDIPRLTTEGQHCGFLDLAGYCKLWVPNFMNLLKF